MAPSFRDLIDFLLAEIALCGDQGMFRLLSIPVIAPGLDPLLLFIPQND
jgi:hypothetical protein